MPLSGFADLRRPEVSKGKNVWRAERAVLSRDKRALFDVLEPELSKIVVRHLLAFVNVDRLMVDYVLLRQAVVSLLFLYHLLTCLFNASGLTLKRFSSFLFMGYTCSLFEVFLPCLSTSCACCMYRLWSHPSLWERSQSTRSGKSIAKPCKLSMALS